MKNYYSLAIAGTLFLIATASSFIIRSEPKLAGVSTAIAPGIALGCSPKYIPRPDESISPLPGWGKYRWKITTKSDSAQFYFNQGINMYYGFHIIEARASFDKATRFDPSCAMAWWGKALAFGPNINDFVYQPPSEAHPSAAKAYSLKSSCTKPEQALINAMMVRYSTDTSVHQPELNERYKNAMAMVRQVFPGHADIGALYADALMILHPWELYDHDFSPKPWTPELISVLKKTMKLSPYHPGIHHYYIHAVEASAHPENAIQSADWLSTSMPDVAHVTHMPSHIYIRTGLYQKGIGLNDKAIAGYNTYLKSFPAVAENIPLYSLHNLHMKMACAHMAGNYEHSITAAKELQTQIPEIYLTMGGAIGNYVQYLHQSPIITYVRFGKWDEILREKLMDSLSYTPLLQRFARGIAFTRLNRLNEANAELELLKQKLEKDSTLKEPLAPFNSAYSAGVVSALILEGLIASSEKNETKAITALQMAVQKEDSLIYNEPRDWVLPARQYLADVLIKSGKYNEAITVLEKDLTINPSNGWSLTGISEAYTKSKKTTEAAAAKKRLKSAWMIRDVPIEHVVF